MPLGARRKRPAVPDHSSHSWDARRRSEHQLSREMATTPLQTPKASPQATPSRGRASPVALLQGILPYNRAWLSRDIVAGITLAALAIPEVMGYTKIAGTPVVTGLYTLILPVIAFGLLGSSRHLVVGGDSATAAIMYAGIAGLGIAGVGARQPPMARAGEPQRPAVRRPAAHRPRGAPGLPCRLHLADRARRFPDRRRHPGRDGPGRRSARRPHAASDRLDRQ